MIKPPTLIPSIFLTSGEDVLFQTLRITRAAVKTLIVSLQDHILDILGSSVWFPCIHSHGANQHVRIKSNQIKSDFICIAQNHNLQSISLGFNRLYSCDILCPQTLGPGEEKLKIATIFSNNPSGRPVESTWDPSARTSFSGVARKQQARAQQQYRNMVSGIRSCQYKCCCILN